jgi:quercetin dioxygenase-like cupin family protein
MKHGIVSKQEDAEKPEEAKRLTGLLHYQPASVVSRVLLKNKGGTVTLFAFSAGEGLSEHTAPFDALLHVIEGEANVYIAPETPGELHSEPNAGEKSTEFRVCAGEVITLPANRAHAVNAVTDFKMLLTMIRA